MPLSVLLSALPIFAAAAIVAAGIMALTIRLTTAGHGARSRTTPAHPPTREAVFLFAEETLVDASPGAHDLLATLPGGGTERERLARFLDRRYPAFADRHDPAGDPVTLSPIDGTDMPLTIRAMGSQVRISLGNAEADRVDPLVIAAMEDELALLRVAGEDAPQLIWKEDAEGRILWANRAYLALADHLAGLAPDDVPTWPPHPIFPDLASKTAPQQAQRLALGDRASGGQRWFDITTTEREGGLFHFAMDVTAIVGAERQGKAFVQTLTKTFAQLSIGLAIFDRDRRLAVFNPALIDLTGLHVEFLSARPSAFAVLDRLRDAQMLPEPRDYATWRDHFAALEAEAERGTYSENWSMPSGRTYRVSGRPHPDGAIAFLFEDISDEVTQTRSYRSQLSLAQNVIDVLEEGIAVFSPGGALVMTNATYDDLWGRAAGALAASDIDRERSIWQDRSAPSPIWDRLRASLSDGTARTAWSEQGRLVDGRGIRCRATPLPGGSTLIGFSIATSASEAPIEHLDTPDRKLAVG